MVEEEGPRPPTGLAARFQSTALDGWSVEELRAYIATLQGEIARAEAAIAARQRHRGAADAFFRLPGTSGE